MRGLYKEERQFGLLVAAIITALLLYRFYKVGVLSIPLVVAGVMFTLTAVVYPKLLHYPLNGWIKFGDLLGKINSYILLTIIFFVILVPMGLIRRFLKGDTLYLKGNRKSTCWHTAEQKKNRFELQF